MGQKMGRNERKQRAECGTEEMHRTDREYPQLEPYPTEVPKCKANPTGTDKKCQPPRGTTKSKVEQRTIECCDDETKGKGGVWQSGNLMGLPLIPVASVTQSTALNTRTNCYNNDMTTLDHRILIPAPGPVVWGYLKQIENNEKWQEDCASITFLSQKQQGVGTRWRQRSSGRYELVYEITTWYDGLGYEYVLIDGAPFSNVEARIRLQEIAEGTIVQWTFTYELGGGVLGDIRNALSTERRQNQAIITSLKTLWKETKRLGSLEGYTPRSLMSDGPPLSSNERISQGLETSTPISNADLESSVPPSLDREPPISDEDTRPRAAIADEAEVSEPTTDDPTGEVKDADSRFAPPTADPSPKMTDAGDTNQPAGISEPNTTPQPEVTSPAQADKEIHPEAAPPSTDEAESADADDEMFEPQLPDGKDTGEVSIWEVFGVPSPTDTQKMRAIRAAEEAEAEYEAEVNAEQGSDDVETITEPIDDPEVEKTGVTRMGLRGRLRRRLANVRHPGEE